MLNETQARELLRLAGAHIPVQPESTQELVRRGRQAARVRRASLVGTVIAAVALLVAGGLVLRTDAETSGLPVDTPTVARVPQAPPGMRLVGMGRIAVAVPESWSTNDVKCGTPMSDSVVFDSEGVRSCLVRPDQPVSSLHIVSSFSSLAEPFLSAATPADEVDGVATRRTPVAIVVDSEDVVMWVESDQPQVVDEILNSVIVLPEGYVTVPYVPFGPLANTLRRMADAGLEVRTVEEHRPGISPEVLLDSDPPLGSVVAVGSAITVTISAGPEHEPPKVDITPCADLPELPVDTEINTVLDKQFGLLEYSYYAPELGEDRSYTVDYWRDSDCVTRPDVRRLLAGIPMLPMTEVPILTDYSKTEAVSRLQDWGLRGEVAGEPAACTPLNSVIYQLPRAGVRVPEGSTVTVVVAARSAGMPVCPGGVALEHDRAIADAFYDFAIGKNDFPPIAPRVSLGLGDDVIQQIDETDAYDRASWQLPGPYAGATGPFSALDYLVDSGGSYRVDLGYRSDCDDSIPPPRGLKTSRILSVQPRSFDDCLQWWRIDLFVNDVGQITAVMLTLREP